MIAQDTLHNSTTQIITQNTSEKSSRFLTYPYNKKRVTTVAIANIAAYTGSMIALNALWYKNQPRSSFHFFNDNDQWLQMDKAGHVYSAYVASNASMEMWRWAGLERNKRIWLGGLGGVAYQSIIEILDGFSSEYGFSVGDFATNMLGSGIFVAQEFAWDEQKITIKFSFHNKNYPTEELENRANQLYGKSAMERFMKDYNGQSYWVSANLQSLTNSNTLPEWLNLAVGYGAENMFGGTENIARDKDGQITFDRRDLKRYRQWYLSPDIDFTRIKTNKKGVKVLLFVLNSFKIPAPGLELSNGKLKGKWLVF
ncbi:MAG: DUF2279 domain-containing protein [Ginsengibacter sp.]